MAQTPATFTFDELLNATGGKLVSDASTHADDRFSLSTDSRSLSADQAFIPLVGERFDGHNFLIPALEEAGLRVAFCQSTYAETQPETVEAYRNAGATLVAVADTLLAYQALAQHHRRRCRETTIVALTGSSGKTTVKDFLRQTLSPYFRVQATEKNYNNDIGVAQTLLAIQPETQVAIVEMGMRGLGEIARLSRMAEPDIALLINVGPAHLERLGSLENIAIAKCELVEGLKPHGTLVSNGDNALLQQRLSQIKLPETQKHHRYSLENQSIRLEAQSPESGLPVLWVKETENAVEPVRIPVPLPGDHMASNMLAVWEVAKILGLKAQQIAEAIAQYQPPEGRFERIALPYGHQLLNDAYNANPASMQASLQAFLNSAPNPAGARRVLILGGMRELGPQSPNYHQALFQAVMSLSPTQVPLAVFVGPEFQEIPVVIQGTTPSVILQPRLDGVVEKMFNTPGLLNTPLEFYLKGSRGNALETLIDPIRDWLAQNGRLAGSVIHL